MGGPTEPPDFHNLDKPLKAGTIPTMASYRLEKLGGQQNAYSERTFDRNPGLEG